MKERIEAIIQHERLTPSQFADAIGVQRSGISHILSGRNKPSLDFLNKLLERFPHISGDWLITGHGLMLKGANKPSMNDVQMRMPLQEETPKKSFKVPQKLVKEEEKMPYETSKPPQSETTAPVPFIHPAANKRIERVIVFYTDKSFTEYVPEK